MNKRLPIAILVIALLAVLGFLLLRDHGTKNGGKKGTAAGVVAGGASSASGDEAASGPHAFPDPRLKKRATIGGTVRVKDGGPLAGANVCSSWSAEGATADDTREPVCTKTDAAGAYKLTELVPGYHRISAFANAHVPASWRDPERRRDSVELVPGEQRTGIDITLTPGGVEISGTVEDVSGGPVADALVSVRSGGNWWSNDARAFTRSDAQGHFTLWTKKGEANLYAEAEGYAPGSTESVAPTKTAEILLTPESVLAGVVIEHDSKTPIEGAIVSVGDWRMGEDSSDGSARTDAQGRFRLTRLAPGRYKPTASARGRYGEPGESVLLGLGQSVEDVVIELHAAATLRGKIVIDEGDGKTKPCADGGWASLQDERAGRWEGDGADKEGNIEITGLLPGTYEVDIYCEGFLPKDKYDAITVATADVDGLVWTVGVGGRISGVVKTASGEVVEDANVSAQTTGGMARGQRTWGNDQTRADGTFMLKGLVAGEYTLDVYADGHRQPDDPVKATVPAAGEAKVEVVLPESGKIAGTVVDTDGKPVKGASVRVANVGWGWGGGGEGKTGDDGTFLIDGVRPGDRRVVATRGWWSEMRRPGSTDDDVQGERVTVAAGKTANVRLVVEARNGVITGTVTDEKGEPVVDAWVIASRESEAAGRLADSAARRTRWSWGSDDRPVITGVDGKFKVTELSPGTYAVRAFRRGGGEAVGEHVKVGGSVALVIRSTGTIAGTVKTTEGAPLPDEIYISVADEKTGFSRREKFFRTGGAFAMRDLPAGNFLVAADSSAGRVMTTVPLASGQSKTDIVLTLERKVTIKGRMVEIGTDTPVPGLSTRAQPVKGARTGMIIMGGGGSDKENISGEDGRFTIENAPTGKVWVSAWPMDWEASPYSWTRSYAEIAQADVVDIGDVEVIKKRKKENEPEGDLGFTTAEQPPDLDPTLGEIKVAHVRPGGPAARSGIVVGDVITTIDGYDVKGVHASRSYVLMDVKEGTQVTFGLARGESAKITAGPPL